MMLPKVCYMFLHVQKACSSQLLLPITLTMDQGLIIFNNIIEDHMPNMFLVSGSIIYLS
jgi:hypothetical protein